MSKIEQLMGYYYAIKNYLQTPKGRHDALDYTQAAAIIMGIAAAVAWGIKWINTFSQ